jgi:hypothetical protein
MHSCVRVAGRAAWARTCVCRISQCITRVSQRIYIYIYIYIYIGESEARNDSAAFDSSSCSSWTGVPIRHVSTGLQGDARSSTGSGCASSGAITHCRDDESAGTAQAGHRGWHQIQVCSHDAPSTYPGGRAPPTLSPPFLFYSRHHIGRKTWREKGGRIT